MQGESTDRLCGMTPNGPGPDLDRDHVSSRADRLLRAFFVGILGSLLVNGCSREQMPVACYTSFLSNEAGDTLATWAYEGALLTHITTRNPFSINYFVYEMTTLVREEIRDSTGTLQHYRSFEYGPDSLLSQIVAFRLSPAGQWEAYEKQLFVHKGFVNEELSSTEVFTYVVEGTEEILSRNCTWEWEGDLLQRESCWQQDPAQASKTRLESRTTVTYDTQRSPWPNFAAVAPWHRKNNPLSRTHEQFSYLPSGEVSIHTYRQQAEYRYQFSGLPTEIRFTDWDGQTSIERYEYVCE